MKPIKAPTNPTFETVVTCCKAGLIHHDGSVHSIFPAAMWRIWLRVRFAFSPRYKEQILNALRYARDNPQPKSYGKRVV